MQSKSLFDDVIHIVVLSGFNTQTYYNYVPVA